MAKKQKIIQATRLFTGERWENDVKILVEGGKICDVGKFRTKADYNGIVTPAFIDAHSHIAMMRAGEPSSEQEVNDYIGQFQPSADPINSLYFDDASLSEACAFGVLYSCIIPGSGNLFGGRSRVIRNFAGSRQNALFSDYGYKMALGYNPRGTQSWKGERPNTRMGLYRVLENKFEEVLLKQKKALLKKEKAEYELSVDKSTKDSPEKQARMLKFIEREYELALDQDEHCIISALNGEKWVKVHVHKEDDVLYLEHLMDKYSMKVTAEHLGDVHSKDIFKRLSRRGVPIVYGPLGSFSYKTELKHCAYDNARLLMESGAYFGLMTDHPVINAAALRDSLKFFLIQGMNDVDALKLITSINADILEIGDRVGRVETGKLASLLLWDRDPLHLAAHPTLVMAEGRVLR